MSIQLEPEHRDLVYHSKKQGLNHGNMLMLYNKLRENIKTVNGDEGKTCRGTQ